MRDDARVVAKRQVDPAPLERGHRLQLEHLAGLDDAGRGSIGEFAQLALAPASVILDIDEDPRPGTHLLRQHEVDQVLQRGEALSLATDESAEGLLLVTIGHDVESARLAGLDLDPNVEPEVAHQAFEDRLAGREGLGRRLGCFKIRPLGGQ